MRSSRLPCPEGVLSFCCRPIDTEPRVQSPLERRPSMVSMDRPEMGSVSMGRQQKDKTPSGQGGLEDRIQVTPRLREHIL